ncbi:hypothetical protein L596_022966 [Steinernema carpocapsae]|uniref:Uncharacterized protein n=1 Tax=Steinernema carpocapsae TaxID=34508 RepID=A0A4U5MC62_STECR|nr:hypothetical protein L596_022966 [Steinernema carpocapsae]
MSIWETVVLFFLGVSPAFCQCYPKRSIETLAPFNPPEPIQRFTSTPSQPFPPTQKQPSTTKSVPLTPASSRTKSTTAVIPILTRFTGFSGTSASIVTQSTNAETTIYSLPTIPVTPSSLTTDSHSVTTKVVSTSIESNPTSLGPNSSPVRASTPRWTVSTSLKFGNHLSFSLLLGFLLLLKMLI